MNHERAIFSVTPEAIDASHRQEYEHGRGLMRHAWEHFGQAQPWLTEYVREIITDESIEVTAYAAGLLTSYIYVNNQLELDGDVPEITASDIGLHAYNTADYNLFEMPVDEKDILTFGLSEIYTDESLTVFLEKLEKSSPVFADIVMNQVVNLCPTLGMKKSYLRGVYDVFMPFYNKSEAEYLYDKLVWLPGLQKAVEDGYIARDSIPDDTADS